MKFMLTFTFTTASEARDAAVQRFKQTGGMPPEGVKFLARYTAADLSGGFVLLETTNPTALSRFGLMWSDVLDLRFIPVVEDAALVEAIKLAGR